VRRHRLDADQPHQQRRTTEQPALEGHQQGDRRTNDRDLPKPRPFGAPPAPEQAVTPELAVERQDRGIGQRHRGHRHDAAECGALQPHRGKAAVAEDEQPVGQDAEAQRHDRHHHRPAGAAERGGGASHRRGHDARDQRKQQDVEERTAARSHDGVLPREPKHGLSMREQDEEGNGHDNRQPHRHAERPPNLAHRMFARAEFGGDDRRACRDHAGECPHDEAEQENAECGGGELHRAEPCDEDDVNRIDRHLEQVGSDQRCREADQRAEFVRQSGGRWADKRGCGRSVIHGAGL
jgi:hypothetical protein